MNLSKLLAACQAIDETGLVYIVRPDGEIRPVRVEAYLAMPMRELDGTLLMATRGCAEAASLRVRGIETTQIQRN